IDYPTTDGEPMAETDEHADVMIECKQVLRRWYADDPNVYVGGNLLVYYEEGNPRKHLAPDVFVVHGVSKTPPRPNYLIWKEGKAPQAVMEITSSSTAKNDLEEKFRIYRDVWKVQEYFLFDPLAEYLKPPLQGYRLQGKRYVRIKPVAGRLPSQVLGLHLERQGQRLRFYDPVSGQYLQTAQERNIALEEKTVALEEKTVALEEKTVTLEEKTVTLEQALQAAQAEIERLRRQLGTSEQ
ncbi:MAG: Uma2 family endonuclease, partial [Gemmataceae bacterium]|nr:Uma2 family endonuclease [Gemmataceae bacterium]